MASLWIGIGPICTFCARLSRRCCYWSTLKPVQSIFTLWIPTLNFFEGNQNKPPSVLVSTAGVTGAPPSDQLPNGVTGASHGIKIWSLMGSLAIGNKKIKKTTTSPSYQNWIPEFSFAFWTCLSHWCCRCCDCSTLKSVLPAAVVDSLKLQFIGVTDGPQNDEHLHHNWHHLVAFWACLSGDRNTFQFLSCQTTWCWQQCFCEFSLVKHSNTKLLLYLSQAEMAISPSSWLSAAATAASAGVPPSKQGSLRAMVCCINWERITPGDVNEFKASKSPHLVLWKLLLSARGSEFLYPAVPQEISRDVCWAFMAPFYSNSLPKVPPKLAGCHQIHHFWVQSWHYSIKKYMMMYQLTSPKPSWYSPPTPPWDASAGEVGSCSWV